MDNTDSSYFTLFPVETRHLILSANQRNGGYMEINIEVK